MSKQLQKLEKLHKEREDELKELFDRTDWIFEDKKDKTLSRQKKEIYMPDGIDVLKLRESMDIKVNWKKNVTKKSVLPLLFMTVFWNAVVSIFIIAILVGGQWAFIPFIAVHTVIGVSMIYYLLALFFNESLINISRDEISINHTPVFSLLHKQTQFKTTDIDQCYVLRKVSGRVNGVPSFAYSLYCKLKNGRSHKLIHGLSHESLLFLEQEIENYIGINDQKIAGEAI